MEDSAKSKKKDGAIAHKNDSVFRTYTMEALIIILLLIMALVYFASAIFVVVPAGHKGVYFRTLYNGTHLNKYYDEGLRLKLPWDKIVLYNSRIQEHHDSIMVLTEDGLDVLTQISFRYYPEYNKLGRLHKEIGPDYLTTILVPRITAITRDVISKYDVEKLYSTSRDSIQQNITDLSKYQITDNYPIIIVDVVIRRIVLPDLVEEAINRKLVYEQQMLEYEFRLKLEEQEVIRKQIEARGIKIFTDSSQLDILKWYGIQATEALAKSPNAKVIVIGTDSGDLPIILGGNN